MSVALATSQRVAGFRCWRIASSPRHIAWVFILSLALLSAQFLGLLHGIAHAGWPVTGKQAVQMSFSAALFNDDDGGAQSAAHTKHHHSCLEYDAAAGAAGIHVNIVPPPPIPAPRVLALLQAFASWDAPVDCPFSSRAPPR